MTALGKIVKWFHHYLKWLLPTKAKEPSLTYFACGERRWIYDFPKGFTVQRECNSLNQDLKPYPPVPFFAVITIMSLIHSYVEFILILDSGFLSHTHTQSIISKVK